MQKSQRQNSSRIPTSSMADIAFLLLIFFLVTTVIDVDTGIGMTLPPSTNEQPPRIKERNLLNIRVNNHGAILLEDKPMFVEDIRNEVKRHVANCFERYAYGCVSQYAESPQRALISIKTSEATSYQRYIDVLDEIWMAYFELWDKEAEAMGYVDYAAYAATLSSREENVIKRKIPAHISVADPDPADL